MTTTALCTRTVIALILGALLVALCYFFVDRPVAQFLHDHRIVARDSMVRTPWRSLVENFVSDHGIAAKDLRRWPQLLSDYVHYLAALAIVLVLVWRLWKKGGRLQTALAAIAVDLLALHLVRPWAKWACGRYWPESWDLGRPSWIGSGEYGFHPFHFGPAYESFPSGHALVTFSVATILWCSYPRWRWCYVLACAAMCAALVGLNYHFVGDVVGGGVLGSIIGVCVWYAFQRADRGRGPSA
jgi:membrane-associated phospholipid phosphatase